MEFILDKETGLYDPIENFVSWMPPPKQLTEEQFAYLSILEKIFKVKNARDEWIPYKLSNHQMWFHLYDYTLCKGLSKNKVVKKSRNTSFTVSSIINLEMASSELDNPVGPVIKLNASESEALIKNFNEIGKHITPITSEEFVMPYDPNDLKSSAIKKMVMPNGNEFVAFPANSNAAENIRGTRTHFGLIDEANFMRKYIDLFVALRKASYGTDSDGGEHFQMLIGTTLRGMTPFGDWLEKLEEKSNVLTENHYISEFANFVIFDWPIFDRIVFDKYYKGKPNEEIPFMDNDELISLVPWQSKQMLWNDYLHDYRVFLEENMAVKVDSDEQFYNVALIMSAQESDLMISLQEMEEKLGEKYDALYFGIDVASVNDYFVITGFGRNSQLHYEQFHLEYVNKVELDEMETRCIGIFNIIEKCGLNWKCKIDSFGIGLQIYQKLNKLFTGKISGNSSVIKDQSGKSHRLNEYAHTKLKRMMVDKTLKLQEDTLLIKHFSGIDYSFNADKNANGHCDICMACCYAMISDERKTMGDGKMYVANPEKKQRDQDSNEQRFMKDFKNRIRKKGLYR